MNDGVTLARFEHSCWLGGPTKVAAIALTNKIARMAWAMMAKGESYKDRSHLRRDEIAPTSGVM
jgi:hypothetical protein